MSTKFFISFVACDVNVIGDLFYITLHLYNRQYIILKNFIFYRIHLRNQIIYLHISSIVIYKHPTELSIGVLFHHKSYYSFDGTEQLPSVQERSLPPSAESSCNFGAGFSSSQTCWSAPTKVSSGCAPEIAYF